MALMLSVSKHEVAANAEAAHPQSGKPASKQ
jgi:hypothetical protein